MHFFGLAPHFDRPQVVLVVFPKTFNFGALQDPQGALGLHDGFLHGAEGEGHELQTGVFAVFSHFGHPFFWHPHGMFAVGNEIYKFKT